MRPNEPPGHRNIDATGDRTPTTSVDELCTTCNDGIGNLLCGVGINSVDKVRGATKHAHPHVCSANTAKNAFERIPRSQCVRCPISTALSAGAAEGAFTDIRTTIMYACNIQRTVRLGLVRLLSFFQLLCTLVVSIFRMKSEERTRNPSVFAQTASLLQGCFL